MWHVTCSSLIRSQYIADVRKYGIGDSDPASFEISDSPVIFLKHGRLVEKLWNAPAATSTAQPRSWASSQAVALQGAPHDMDSTPSTPEDARFILGEIRDVDSQGKAGVCGRAKANRVYSRGNSGHHYLEMVWDCAPLHYASSSHVVQHMETRVNGQWSTIIYHLPGEPLIYRFIIDTGTCALLSCSLRDLQNGSWWCELVCPHSPVCTDLAQSPVCPAGYTESARWST